jgi:hypothetical protein
VASLSDRIPPEGQRLLDELQRHGYAIAEERQGADHFGDALAVLACDRARVRVVRDRGQWFVEAAGARGDEWFAPVIWKAFLDGSAPPAEAASFEDQARLLLDEREAIEASGRALDEEGLARLRCAARPAGGGAQSPATFVRRRRGASVQARPQDAC